MSTKTPHIDRSSIFEAAPVERRYDLDALRGFAMLLGIALHAAIAFVPYRSDSQTGAALSWGFFEFVHGFRMPIFFILSGYFTTMLWQRRGLGGVLSHRLKRIGLPLLAGVVTIVPLVRLAFTAADSIAGNSAATRPSGFGFSHLWFLWFLALMVVGFAATVTVLDRARSIRVLAWSTSPRVATLALVALPLLTVVPASRMVDELFGADYSDTLVPNDGVLSYYLCFFTFGALLFGRHDRNGTPLIDAFGRFWLAQLAIASFVLFPLGRSLMSEHWTASAAVQVAFAWMMSFGLLGAFRSLLNRKSALVAWLSDASYWMYLAHLPMVIVLQAIASRMGLPPIVAVPVIFVTATSFLMLSYQRFVRYSPIGTMLNGKRLKLDD
ncbi:MAG: glucan biosynthesis protein C [Verrucomicrobiales bacterium]|jgi:glucan biosynthesis protein C